MSINTHGAIPHCESMLTTRSNKLRLVDPVAPPHGLPTKLMRDKSMELILIILLLVVLFGGGFGFYRGGYYRQGGPVGIGGILGFIAGLLVVRGLGDGALGGLAAWA